MQPRVFDHEGHRPTSTRSPAVRVIPKPMAIMAEVSWRGMTAIGSALAVLKADFYAHGARSTPVGCLVGDPGLAAGILGLLGALHLFAHELRARRTHVFLSHSISGASLIFWVPNSAVHG